MYIREMLWPLILLIGGFEPTRMLKSLFVVSLALAMLRKRKKRIVSLFSGNSHVGAMKLKLGEDK